MPKMFTAMLLHFFQLMFHCPDVIEYFQMNHQLLDTEDLLRKIVASIHGPDDRKSIVIDEFLKNWTGWIGGTTLPKTQEDIFEFAQYLFASLTPELFNYFLIGQDFAMEPPYHQVFIFPLKLASHLLQECLNESLRVSHIDWVDPPKYLLLRLDRMDHGKFDQKAIGINTFLRFRDFIYEFNGVCIFHPPSGSGHYTTILQIGDAFLNLMTKMSAHYF